MLDTLLTPISENTLNTFTKSSNSNMFIEFLNSLEGAKTRCKNLHWAAHKKNTHVYLDEFLSILSDFQDAIAEDYMGIEGKLAPNIIVPTSSMAIDALSFIRELCEKVQNFYSKIPTEIKYKGITAECETFIHELNKYKYLFSLCDV